MSKERHQDAEYWFDQGNNYFRLSQLKKAPNTCYNKALIRKARNCYSKATELDPNNADAWVNRGNVLFILDEREEAIVCYDKAIKINPDHAEAYYNKGSVLNLLSRFKEALDAFDKAVELDPDNKDAWTNRGITLGMLGRFSKSKASFAKAKGKIKK